MVKLIVITAIIVVVTAIVMLKNHSHDNEHNNIDD